MHLNTFCVLCTVKANEQKKERTKTYNKETGEFHNQFVLLTPFRLGFLRVAQLGRGGGRKVPAACNSKTINDNEMKLDGVVKDH